MANTNSIFVLSFWLPKYFHDQFKDSGVDAQYYNVIPWIGVIPGSIVAGLFADLLVKKSSLSLSQVRRYTQMVCNVGGAAFAKILAGDALDIHTTLFLTAIMIFLMQFHN